MSRKLVYVVMALAAYVTVAAPAHAQRRKSQEAAPPPVQFKITEPTRSFALTRAQNLIPAHTNIGNMYDDALCALDSRPVYSEHALTGMTDAEVAGMFKSEMIAAGYKQPGPADNMFEAPNEKAPELMVGVMLQKIEVKGCPTLTIVGTPKRSMSATVTVEWQLYDPLEKKMLLKATTHGTAQVSGPIDYVTKEAARAAFMEASKALLSNESFVQAVRLGEPAGAAPSPTPDSAPAPAAAATQTIPHIALSTKPFQEQISQLRLQVPSIRTGEGHGSGFVIAPGLLMTNEHVVRGAQRVKIKMFGGTEVDGEVLQVNARRDVAIVRTAAPEFSTALPLRMDDPTVGAQVYVIGSPVDIEEEGSVSAGIISGFRNRKEGPFIQSDVAVTFGNSGGPMFDDRGNVIGITDIGLRANNGAQTAVNLFIPIGDALHTLGLEIAPNVTASTR